jgi:Domain of unknown function (DUF4407)
MNMHVPNVRKVGPFTGFFLRVVGVDVETLEYCPAHDRDTFLSLSAISAFVWCIQASLFTLISHRLFAAPSQFRPELLVASAFIATFIQQLTAYQFHRSGFHLEGIGALKRGGLDVSGGPLVRIKAFSFLLIRLALSICIAQLAAIFFGMLVFADDISARIDRDYSRANVSTIRAASLLVDGEIKRATEAVTTESARASGVADQVARLRRQQVDPSAGDADVEDAQQEIAELRTQKAKANDELRSAESFSTDELGGIRGTADNSGRPGDGPRHKAAVQKLIDAHAHAADADKALDKARVRLEALRDNIAMTAETTKQQAVEELPGFEEALKTETVKMSALKSELARLTRERDRAIRTAVENAPDHVRPANGLIGQLTALEAIAHEDPIITVIILLIDLVSFGFELAAVLAKMCFVPTTYSALLAKNAYLSVVRIVDDMVAELNMTPLLATEIASALAKEAANENEFNAGKPPGTNPLGGTDGDPQPPKRGRGRPRKNRLN